MKLATFIIQVLLARLVFGTDCGQYTTQSQCNSYSPSCSWINNICQCFVYREMDFVFAIDKSGSMGNDWNVVLDWLKYVIPSLNVNSRVAWIPFDSQIYPDTHNDNIFDFPPLSHWNHFKNCCDKNQQTTNLLNYIDNRLPFPGGGTDLEKPVAQAIDWYTDPSIEGPVSRQKILIIVTDGVGGSPCSLKQEVTDANIRVIIIGISDEYSGTANCLLSDPNDLYLIPTHQDINNIDARFYKTICDGEGTTTTPAPTMSEYEKCQQPCKEGTSGPCIKKAPGDNQCDAYYVGTTTCPWDSYNCGGAAGTGNPTTSPTISPSSPTTTRAPTMTDKCEHGCVGPVGPCMHTNLGDYTCHQYNAFGQCPQGTEEGDWYDCMHMDEKCLAPCYGDTSGPCMHLNLGDFSCFEKVEGGCPAGTIDCSARTSAALNNGISGISKNVKDFEYNINKDMRIMGILGGLTILGCLICIIGVLIYVYNKTKNKALGFSKVGTSDFDTVATGTAVN